MLRFAARLFLSALILSATVCAAQAEPAERATCAAVSGRGYTGGCGQMENRSVTIDAPDANFPDTGTACQAARIAATQQLTAQLRAADRAKPGGFNFCSTLNIRCVASCGQVQK
jgi:hypothetical protein